MELKWLEDFASLARTGNFSRSAEERHVTQSAFSRRIKALEAWLGVALVDRSTYPTTLTPEGRLFRETAEEAIRLLQAGRSDLQARRAPRHSVAVAALHTLALSFFPAWFRTVTEAAGPLGRNLGSRLLPDDFHACMQALVEGGYDFLLTFHHPGVPILLDPALFPHRVVGADALVAVRSAAGPAAAPPRLGYPRDSFLGRVLAQAGVSADTAHVNENAMAEALKFMVLEGHGAAWLPQSLVRRELAAGSLLADDPGGAASNPVDPPKIPAKIPLEIRLYRNAAHRRPAVEAVWNATANYSGTD